MLQLKGRHTPHAPLDLSYAHINAGAMQFVISSQKLRRCGRFVDATSSSLKPPPVQVSAAVTKSLRRLLGRDVPLGLSHQLVSYQELADGGAP